MRLNVSKDETHEPFPITVGVPIRRFGFPGGERHVRIDGKIDDHVRKVSIFAHIHSSDDLMDLLLLNDAARRLYPTARFKLNLPYFPYARQDRVAVEGEPLSAAVAAGLINAMGFDLVVCWDLHSDVSKALIHRLTHRDARYFVDRVLNQPRFHNCTLVSPDAGARKRVNACAHGHSVVDIIEAEKMRDPVTGDITGTVVHGLPTMAEHLKKAYANTLSNTYLIVDDICDGGRTFTEIAKAIRAHYDTEWSGERMFKHGFSHYPIVPQIYLYVTHGIFSKGLGVLKDGGIDAVYTPNSFPTTADRLDLENFLTIL